MTEPLQAVAIGRPVEARDPRAAGWPLYDDSVQIDCTVCKGATWFGPRLQVLIGAGKLEPVCADCLIDSMVEGDMISGMINLIDLGNPSQPRVTWWLRET